MSSATMRRQGSNDRLYREVEDRIYSLVWYFVRTFGDSFEEVRSRACEHFMDAVASYEPHQGKFGTWAFWKVRCGLLEWKRREIGHDRIHTYVTVDWDKYPGYEYREFDFKEFTASMSEDARAIVGMVFDTPADITLHFHERGADNYFKFRLAIREYLRDLGWSVNRILESFKEIKEALG